MQRCFKSCVGFLGHSVHFAWLALFLSATVVVAAEPERRVIPSETVASRPATALVIQLPLESVSTHRTRYRRLHGRWWYWLPSENQWALWDGGRWTLPGKDGNRLPVVASRTARQTIR